MVFIHGGGFYENSGSEDLYSPEFLMTEDIVLVTINYRLGIFGKQLIFFTTAVTYSFQKLKTKTRKP